MKVAGAELESGKMDEAEQSFDVGGRSLDGVVHKHSEKE